MVDVNLRIPALEKLVDYVASGIGAVGGPMLAPWKARQEAEASHTKAESDASSLKLISEAQAEARRTLVAPDAATQGVLEIGSEGITQRIEFQEKKRQANIVAVVQDAAAALADKEVLGHEPDPDWTARFFDCVQDVSSEDMQRLWSKVLSGEVESPGRTSLRTLDVLRNMTSIEAQKFEDVCIYAINDFVFYEDKIREKYPELSYDNLITLQEAGLVTSVGSNLGKKIRFKNNDYCSHIEYNNLVLKIFSKDKKLELKIPSILLTSAGKELLRLARQETRMDYLESFSRFLHSNGCDLSFAQVLEKRSDGIIAHSEPFVPVAPAAPPSGSAAP